MIQLTGEIFRATRRPLVDQRFESTVRGPFVVGDLTGAPVVKLAMEQGHQSVLPSPIGDHQTWCNSMKSLLLLALVSYDIKPGPDNRFALEISKTGLMSGKKHLFVFDRYSGSLKYDASGPEFSRVDLEIESAGFVVKDDWVNAKQAVSIREEAEGKNGLDVTHFPRMRFVASSIARAGDAYAVQGTLAIRGIEKPITVTVTMKPGDAGALRFEGTAEVKLKDYGIKPPTAALGLIGTRNEMTVSFSLNATPRR